MTVPHIIFPSAIIAARNAGSLSPAQVDIYLFGYSLAERPEYRVRGFSAANVLRFREIDATKANIKRYEREARDLWERNLITRDYYQIDPTRSDKKNRPYSIWLPRPERFLVVGTPEENRVSLWKSNVGLVVVDNVAVPKDETSSDSSTYSEQQPDNVGVNVGLRQQELSIITQYTSKSERESPLNPQGDFFPPAPQGEHSDAVGLGQSTSTPTPAGIRKSLDANQCVLLNKAALQYVSFSDWIYNFVPDVKAVTNLLREFSPAELWCAQIIKFPPAQKFVKTSMAHFFTTGAKTLIAAARLNGTSNVRPKGTIEKLAKSRPDFSRRWGVVCDAWDAVELTVADGLAYSAADVVADEVNEVIGVTPKE